MSQPAQSKRRSRRRSQKERQSGFVLKIVEGVNIGKTYDFDTAATIGRVEGNDIIIVESGISRQHARVYEEHGVCLVEDLGSANGTFLNGSKIDGSDVLRDGDHLTFSQTTLQFSLPGSMRGEATKQVNIQDAELAALDASDAGNESARHRQGLRRPVRVALVVTLVVAIATIGYHLLGGDSGTVLAPDHSDDPIAYVEKSFEGVVFGYGEDAQSHKNRLILDFEYLGGRVTVQYGAWGIDKVGELAIEINGKRVANAPVTLSRWVYGIKTVLPNSHLKRGETNRLVFNNTRNPPHEDMWEIYDIHIIQEAIPPPDKEEAYRQYELAKKIWDERHIEPGNTYQVLQHLWHARDRLEGLKEKPPEYGEILSFIEQVERVLTRRFEEGLFTARRSEKVNDNIPEAKRILRQTLRFFNKGDYRYRQINYYLSQLEQYEKASKAY